LEIIVAALYWTSVVIFWATIVVAGIFFLRVILTWLGVNPFGRIPYHLTQLTEPMVRPMRYQFRGGVMRYDLVPLLIGILILVMGLSVASILAQLSDIINAISKNLTLGSAATRVLVAQLVYLAGLLYVVAMFLRFFLPLFGVGYNNKFLRFLFAITEPLVKPLRRFFVFGTFDFSPLIAMFAVQLLTRFLANIIAGGSW
jgi:uncharacterized protein YggT (Ycf19 family)